MRTVTVRDLRNHGGDVLDRVTRGEVVVVTRDGTEVAELRPLSRAPVGPAELVARRRGLPAVDVERFRGDVDEVLEAGL